MAKGANSYALRTLTFPILTAFDKILLHCKGGVAASRLRLPPETTQVKRVFLWALGITESSLVI